MNKLLAAVFASALALALALPVASACPGHDCDGAAKEAKKDQDKKETVVKKKEGESDKAGTTDKKPAKVSRK